MPIVWNDNILIPSITAITGTVCGKRPTGLHGQLCYQIPYMDLSEIWHPYCRLRYNLFLGVSNVLYMNTQHSAIPPSPPHSNASSPVQGVMKFIIMVELYLFNKIINLLCLLDAQKQRSCERNILNAYAYVSLLRIRTPAPCKGWEDNIFGTLILYNTCTCKEGSFFHQNLL